MSSMAHILSIALPQQRQERPLKGQAHQHNHQSPGKQVRGIQIDLGLLELLADRALRHTDDLRGNP